jgi:hypothetical protein
MAVPCSTTVVTSAKQRLAPFWMRSLRAAFRVLTISKLAPHGEWSANARPMADPRTQGLLSALPEVPRPARFQYAGGKRRYRRLCVTLPHSPQLRQAGFIEHDVTPTDVLYSLQVMRICSGLRTAPLRP